MTSFEIIFEILVHRRKSLTEHYDHHCYSIHSMVIVAVAADNIVVVVLVVAAAAAAAADSNHHHQTNIPVEPVVVAVVTLSGTGEGGRLRFNS